MPDHERHREGGARPNRQMSNKEILELWEESSDEEREQLGVLGVREPEPENESEERE